MSPDPFDLPQGRKSRMPTLSLSLPRLESSAPNSALALSQMNAAVLELLLNLANRCKQC